MGEVLARPCAIEVPPSTDSERGSGDGKRGSGAGDRMGPPESVTIEGLVVPSAGVSSPLVGISGGLLGMIGESTLAHTVIVK